MERALAHATADHVTVAVQESEELVTRIANSAITQYFFNADSYFYFIDRLEKMDVTIPVVPGIMPIMPCMPPIFSICSSCIFRSFMLN